MNRGVNCKSSGWFQILIHKCTVFEFLLKQLEVKEHFQDLVVHPRYSLPQYLVLVL